MVDTYFTAVKVINWEKIKETNEYFLYPHWEIKMRNLQVGDKIIFYLINKHNIVAIYEVLSNIIKNEGILKVKIKPIKILEEPINFKPYIKKLQLIKNPEKWGTYIQIPLRKLNIKDSKLLLKNF